MCKSERGISLQSLWAVFTELLRIPVPQCWGIAAVENDAVPLVTESKLRRSQTESRCGDKMITRCSLEMWRMVFAHHPPCLADETRAEEKEGRWWGRGFKIKTERERCGEWEREKWLREKKDRGDKMRQIERGTMRLGSKREWLGE